MLYDNLHDPSLTLGETYACDDNKMTCYMVCLQCLFNPGAAGEGNGIVSVVGSGIFKCFKTAENSLKLLTSALAKREPQNYMAHCWLPEGERERMVLGTDTGELLIVEGTELKATIQLDPGSSVVSIAAYAKVDRAA